MPEDRGTLRQIAWSELFPWLTLVRAVRLAIQARLLLLAAVALLLTSAGWWLFGQMFSGAAGENADLSNWIAAYGAKPWVEPALPFERNPADSEWGPNPDVDLLQPPITGWPPGNVVTTPWYNLSAPFRQLFHPFLTLSGLAFVLLCGLWVAVVWGFFAGVITRLVSLNVARNERGSLRAAVRFVQARYVSYFSAPLYPLIGVLLFVLPIALVALIGRAGPGGLAVLAVLWPLFLIAGLAITIFLLGLAFGWPLMWPTISSEGTDSFDALSRSYSYTFQRPLHYLFYVLVAVVVGGLGWFLVRLFAAGLWYLTAWAVSWGAGGDVLAAPADLAEYAPVAARLLSFWHGLVWLVANSFAYTFFFCAATIVYYLLRYEVDGTEMDEVFVEEQDEKFGLPAMAPDASGVATIVESSAENGPAIDNGGEPAL